MQSVEILTDPWMARRGRRMIEAMAAASPMPVRLSQRYTGACDLLLTYGSGHPVRRPWWVQHRQSGRHCVGLDLGYWGRDQGYMRVTIDDDHPPDWIRPEPACRWDATGIELREDADPAGHAVIVGMGVKAVRVHGLVPLQWERGAFEMARAMGLSPILKPKKASDPSLPGVPSATGSMEEALKGAALLICRHSNAAVDACIAGVPVICEGGAALALYGKTREPSREQRLEFLRSLAWWNWHPREAKEAWSYILSRFD